MKGWLLVSGALLCGACSATTTPGGGDAGGQGDSAAPRVDGAGGDAARADARVTDGARADAKSADQRPGDAAASVSESEPNDGKTTTEVNAIKVPVLVRGSIGVADDADVFTFQAQAGDRLVARVQGQGGLRPHLAVFGEKGLGVPASVTSSASGETFAEYYVLKSGAYFVAVRDLRNVGGSSQHVGGPALTYALTVLGLSRPPISATVGSETKATISPYGTVLVFAFTAQKDEKVDVTVLAKRLVPPSDADTRLSLFHPGQAAWLGTNEDLSGSQSDSLLTGNLPFAGTYHAIVENVAAAPGSNLAVTLKLSRP
ncbi:MAG: hypothetical protein IT371_16520 [Deltaproteobacteria bacterium]|nr:hypothetical protein [Deltaproteobacteria bacterium]